MMVHARENPYPGLRPFRRDEAHLFFGRDTLVDEMLLRLSHNRFLGVVGSSGCGKSSLLTAGLIPRVLGGLSAEADGNWRVVTTRPWVDRSAVSQERSLSPASCRSQRRPSTPLMVETALRRSGLALRNLLTRAFPPDARLLIIVISSRNCFGRAAPLPPPSATMRRRWWDCCSSRCAKHRLSSCSSRCAPTSSETAPGSMVCLNC